MANRERNHYHRKTLTWHCLINMVTVLFSLNKIFACRFEYVNNINLPSFRNSFQTISTIRSAAVESTRSYGFIYDVGRIRRISS